MQFFYIFFRYLFSLVIALNMNILYIIFSPLTLYPVIFITSFFYESSIIGNTIIIGDISISLADACIAGSAYLLLLILNLSVRMDCRKRVYSILFSMLAFLILNIARIILFTFLLLNSFAYFDITHKIFWYFVSSILVVLVWFLTIRIFKIKEIPFYTDLRLVYKETRRR